MATILRPPRPSSPRPVGYEGTGASYRAGTPKYYNMDQVVAQALALHRRLQERRRLDRALPTRLPLGERDSGTLPLGVGSQPSTGGRDGGRRQNVVPFVATGGGHTANGNGRTPSPSEA